MKLRWCAEVDWWFTLVNESGGKFLLKIAKAQKSNSGRPDFEKQIYWNYTRLKKSLTLSPMRNTMYPKMMERSADDFSKHNLSRNRRAKGRNLENIEATFSIILSISLPTDWFGFSILIWTEGIHEMAINAPFGRFCSVVERDEHDWTLFWVSRESSQRCSLGLLAVLPAITHHLGIGKFANPTESAKTLSEVCNIGYILQNPIYPWGM